MLNNRGTNTSKKHYYCALCHTHRWMLNNRGNTFSRKHEDYSAEDPRFWSWTIDEMATEDLPAIVAYILGYTGAQKVCVGGREQCGGKACFLR